jgi:hypothetical protein
VGVIGGVDGMAGSTIIHLHTIASSTLATPASLVSTLHADPTPKVDWPKTGRHAPSNFLR